MKYILLFLLLAPMASFAQDCQLRRSKDPFTKEEKLSTGFITLQGGSLTIDADSKEIDFFFTLSGADKCFGEGATVNIFFANSKQKISFRNTGGQNCDGNFHFIFRNTAGTNGNFQKLGTLAVDHFIFIAADKKETILSLLPEQQERLKKFTSCMITESKTLLK